MSSGTKFKTGFSLLVLSLCGFGCMHAPSNNDGDLQSYPVPAVEAGWIRDGFPIEYDGHKWYAIKDFEVLKDSEVFQIGEYKEVQLFVDKLDTKPYDRLYTKFGKNKYRYYEQRTND